MKMLPFFKALILGLFFVSTLWLVVGLPVIFNSPDESANYLFASQFSQTGSLVVVEEGNIILSGIIHPRSVLALGENLLPKSFLGIPILFGIVGLVFGKSAILFITPVLALFSVLAWRSIVQKLFDNVWLADVSAFLFMIHPAFWYYSGRTMMHNVAFVSFLIFSFWFAVYQPFKKWKKFNRMNFFDFLFAGISAAFAIAFRSSEVIWVVPLGLILFWWAKKYVTRRQFIMFAIGFLFAIIPFGIVNNNLYGSFITTGYQAIGDAPIVEVLEGSIESSEPITTTPSLINKIVNILLPFGFAEKAILRHVWQYGIALYPWMTGISVIGIIFLSIKRKVIKNRSVWMKLLGVTLVLSAWLGVVYGSWTFHDNPDPTIFSLGNSYVRYWIPLFLLSSPFGALAVITIVPMFKNTHIQKFVSGIILVILAVLSWNLVFFGDDGFVPTRENLFTFEEKKEVVLAHTQEEAIIVVDRADKFIFPSRRVVTPLRSEVTYSSLAAMENMAPIYYFGITFPEKDIEYLNNVKLAQRGLKIDIIETVFDESLYRIVRNTVK